MFLEHRLRRPGKVCIRKASYGNGDRIRPSFRLPENRASAGPAEVEDHIESAFCEATVGRNHPIDLDFITTKECRQAECAPGSPLAFKTATQRNCGRLPLAYDHQLSAGTRCFFCSAFGNAPRLPTFQLVGAMKDRKSKDSLLADASGGSP